MSKTDCRGFGECLEPCKCNCNIESDLYEDTHNPCTCGHRPHQGYGASFDCMYGCELMECHNYRMCKVILPQYVLNRNRGLCLECVDRFGKLKWQEMSMACPVCDCKKEMIELICGQHVSCILCWRSNSYIECIQCSFANKEEAEAAAKALESLLYSIICLSLAAICLMFAIAVM